MARYEHSGNAVATTISGALAAGATAITLADATGWATGAVGPFVATIDRGTATEERILCLSRVGTSVTIQTRGFDGTTDQAHSSGASIEHTFSATEADEANAAVVELAAVAGTLVGTSDPQTLTSKTLDLGSNTVSGTKAQFNAAMTDDDFATLTGTETLTNKTLTAPILTDPVGAARGSLGHASTTVNEAGFGTTVTDAAGLSVTVTVGAGRRIRISGQVLVSHDNTNHVDLYIREGTTGLVLTRSHAASGEFSSPSVATVETPSAGSHTYKLSLNTSVGTAGLANASTKGWILVEDIGAA